LELTNLLTYSIVQDIPWKADSHSACQTTTCFLYGTQRFVTVLTKSRHRTLSWASRIRFAHIDPYLPKVILLESNKNVLQEYLNFKMFYIWSRNKQ
jgi:hypothetical protein